MRALLNNGPTLKNEDLVCMAYSGESVAVIDVSRGQIKLLL